MHRDHAGRRLFSVGEAYWIFYHAVRSIPRFRRSLRSGLLSHDFMERLMLAVTEVNGCALCSYAHTKMALEAGMRAEEIRALLAGDLSTVPPDELPAVLFAQHYAESRGHPSREAWDYVEKLYGKEKSLAILSAIRMIMLGNAYGIPLTALKDRVLGHAGSPSASRSTVLYEIGLPVVLTALFPLVLVHALAAFILRLPTLAFNSP